MRMVILLTLLISFRASGAEATRLEVFPSTVKLDGPAASQRLVVIGHLDDGSTCDLTNTVEIAIVNDVAKLNDLKKIVPNHDGTGEIVVRARGVEARVPLHVAGSSLPRKVSFRNEIQPALTKLGCSQGACHGSQHGKGGFKLSLLGFEPEPDYIAIVKSAEGRRVTPFAPEESLLLLKPTLAVAHGGGKKLESESSEYALIRLWLEQGAPAPLADEPHVTKLAILPDHGRTTADSEQQFLAMATYSDGTVRDVTEAAKFDPLNEGLATVDANGHALTIAQGESGVMTRYMGYSAIARLTVPYGLEKSFEFDSANILDQKVAATRCLIVIWKPMCEAIAMKSVRQLPRNGGYIHGLDLICALR